MFIIFRGPSEAVFKSIYHRGLYGNLQYLNNIFLFALFQDTDSGTRVAFVSIDCAMMGQLVKLFVVEELEALYPGVYTEKNVVLSSTHTHSGPAGEQ